MFVPNPDIIAATLQAQTANLTSIGWCYVGNDAPNHDVLDSLAIRA